MKNLILFINRNNTYITNKDGIIADILNLLKKLPLEGDLSDIILTTKSIEFTYNVANMSTDISNIPIYPDFNVLKVILRITKKFGYYIISGYCETEFNKSSGISYGIEDDKFDFIDFNKYDWKNIKEYFINLVNIKQNNKYEIYINAIKTQYNLIRDDKFAEMFEILENEDKKNEYTNI